MHTSAERKIRDAGQRVTAQRLLLLRLLDDASTHLDAEELYRQASAEMPGINLSTIYRNLGKLQEAGLVRQRYFARDHSREYFESTTLQEHYHFTCQSCGAVVEFETPLVKQMQHDLSSLYGVEVKHVCICFEGLCDACTSQSPSAISLSFNHS